MIAFILKSTFCLSALYICYVVLLGRTKSFRFNRYFLLLAIAFSLLVPLLRISFNNEKPAISDNNITKAFTALNALENSEFLADNNKAIAGKAYLINAINTAGVIYLIVLLLLLLRFIKNLFSIFLQSKHGRKIKWEHSEIILLDKEIAPYSFWNFIFIGLSDFENGKIDNCLINHELAHKRQLHSIDILIIELVKIFYWFNPMVYLFGRAIKLNHEYLADEYAAGIEANKSQYSKKLIDFSYNKKHIHLASGLNYPQIKKRIIMLVNQNDKRHFAPRLTGVLLTTALLFISTAFVFNTKPTVTKTPDPINTFTGTYSGYRINDSTYFAFGDYYITSASEKTKITARRLKVSIEMSAYKNYFENDFLSGKVYTEGVDIYTNEMFLDKIITLKADEKSYSKDSLTIELIGKAEVKGEDVKIESDVIILHLNRYKKL